MKENVVWGSELLADMKKWNWREGQRPYRRRGGGQRHSWYRGNRQRSTQDDQWYVHWHVDTCLRYLVKNICVSLSDSVCHDPLVLSLAIISGCLFTGLDIMMTVHHSEHLRGDMTTSLPLPPPPHLPLLLPPHPPPHRPLHPLRPAVLHQVSVRYHPST